MAAIPPIYELNKNEQDILLALQKRGHIPHDEIVSTLGGNPSRTMENLERLKLVYFNKSNQSYLLTYIGNANVVKIKARLKQPKKTKTLVTRNEKNPFNLPAPNPPFVRKSEKIIP